MRSGLALALALGSTLAACGGGDDGSTSSACDEYHVAVSVMDGSGAAVPDVMVTIDSTDCMDSGDGITFDCIVTDTGDYNVYAMATGYASGGQQVTVEEPEDCASPAATVDLVILRQAP